MNNAPKIIYFMFPYRGVGGVSLLFLRMAEYLHINGYCESHIIDYSDGYMRLHMSKDICKYHRFEDGKKIIIPDGCIVILQSTPPWSVDRGLAISGGAKILLWNCHPYNLIPTLPGLRSTTLRHPLLLSISLKVVLRYYVAWTRSFVEYVNKKRALLFMDLPNLKTTERFLEIKVSSPIFLPIPAIDTQHIDLASVSTESNTIKVIWVGRIVDFKFHILKHAIVKIDQIQPIIGREVLFTIVGTGDFLSEIKTIANSLKNISINFIDEIEPAELDRVIIKHSIFLGMGTAALEGAKLGIPTILLDPSYKEVSPGYEFKWLYQSIGFSLGSFDAHVHSDVESDSLLKRFNEIITNREDVAHKTLNYYKNTHSIVEVARQFSDQVQSCGCLYHELVVSGLIKQNFAVSVIKWFQYKIKPLVVWFKFYAVSK